jgi:hypothetical protein
LACIDRRVRFPRPTGSPASAPTTTQIRTVPDSNDRGEERPLGKSFFLTASKLLRTLNWLASTEGSDSQGQRDRPPRHRRQRKSGPCPIATIGASCGGVRLGKASSWSPESLAERSISSHRQKGPMCKASVIGTDDNENQDRARQQRSGRAVGASAWERLLLDRPKALASARLARIDRRVRFPRPT